MPRTFSVNLHSFSYACALLVSFLTIPSVPAVADQTDSETLALKRTARAFVRISHSVTSSVANIRTFQRSSSRRFDLTDRFFDRELLRIFSFHGSLFTVYGSRILFHSEADY